MTSFTFSHWSFSLFSFMYFNYNHDDSAFLLHDLEKGKACLPSGKNSFRDKLKKNRCQCSKRHERGLTRPPCSVRGKTHAM